MNSYDFIINNAQVEDLEQLYKTFYDNNELPGKSKGYMYIISPVDENGEFIGKICKIGETKKDLNEYISQELYPKNPFKLLIISQIRGSGWETIFHIRYSQYRVHHEWFTFVDEMLEFTKLLEDKGYKIV